MTARTDGLSVVSETRLFGVPVVRRLAAVKSLPPAVKATVRTTEGTAQEPFKDSRLTYDKVRTILRDPAVKFCNMVMSSPVSRVGLQVKGADPTQVEFVRRNLIENGIAADYMKKAVTARYYGFYVAEVRYEEQAGQIVLRQFKGLPPERVRLIEDKETGQLQSVEYQQPGTGLTKVMLEVKDGKFLLVTYREWESESNRYGLSELEEVREWAFAKRFIKDMMLRWIEGKADPSTGVSYLPTVVGSSTVDGEITEENVGTLAMNLAKSIRQGSSFSVPKDAEGRKLFEVEMLTGADRMPVWDSALKLCNLEIFHALLVPERAVSEGTSGTGSYSQAEVHAQTLWQLQEDLATQVLAPVNDYTIPKWLGFNFPKPDPTVRVVHTGLRDADRELVKMVISAALESAKTGTPLTGEVISWLREKTGTPLDARFLVPPKPAPAAPPAAAPAEQVQASRLLAQPKLRRALTEREQRLPGGERFFLSVNAAWTDMESSLFRDLADIVAQQRAAFQNAIERALAQTTKASRLKAVRDLGLGKYGVFEARLGEGLSEAGGFGLDTLARELRLKSVPGLAPDTVSFIKTQAASTTEAALGKLLAQLRLQALNGVNQEQDAADVIYRIGKVFDGFVEKSLMGDVVKQVSTAINYSRRQAERLSLPDPLVSFTRTAVMDAGTCEVCEHFDNMTVALNDPVLPTLIPPAGCLGGARCHCIGLYNEQSMRPSLREENYTELPARLKEDVWY